MTSNDFRKQLTALAGTAALVASGAVFAQQQEGGGGYEPPPPQQQQQQQQQNFSDDDLAAFADARKEVNSISQDFQKKAQDAEDQSQIAQLRQEANEEMVEAVQDAGLATDKYNAIAQAIRTNPELASKIQDM